MSSTIARLGTAVVAAVLALSTAAAPAYAAGRGTIAGTFTTDAGTPIEQGNVSAWSLDGDWFGNAQTDANGHYRITGAPAQGIQMLFQRDSIVQWAHDRTRPEDADTFTVRNGQTLTVDESLLPTGTISGHLTGPDGNPAPDLMINAHNLDSDQIAYGYAGEDGNYSFDVLPGRYQVSFVRGSGEQWAYQAADPAHARTFTVDAGQTLTVDDTMLPTGTISGRLTAVDGSPVPDDTRVELHQGDRQVSTNWTVEGGYTFDGLLPGVYQVAFQAGDTDQWIAGKRSQADATALTVVADQTTQADDSVLPPTVLHGRLVDSTGAALAEYHVTAERVAGGEGESYDATTGTDGTWQISGPLDGSYRVSFQTPSYGRSQYVPGKGSADEAVPVVVRSGDSVAVDDTWLPGAGLTVTATDATTGAPISNFCVWVVDSGVDQVCGTGSQVTVDDLPAGTFTAEVGPRGSTYYLTSRDIPVTLTSGRTVSLPAQLAQGGRIAVTVTDHVTGRPVRDGCIALPIAGAGSIGDVGQCSNTAGKLTTAAIAPGTYEIFATGPGTYGDQWVGATGGTGDQRTAERIVVRPGQTTPAPAVLLDQAGSISGTVTGPDGKPLADADVSIQAWGYGVGPELHVNADDQGKYTFGGLGPYSWPLAFTAGRLPRQWSGHTANRSEAELIPVTSAATSRYDMALVAGTTITGKATVSRPFQSWRMTAVNATTGDQIGVFDCYDTCDGTYAMPILGDQQVKITWDVSYADNDYASGWWDHAPDQTSATPVDVPADGQQLDLSFG